jgi:hypothetical protein
MLVIDVPQAVYEKPGSWDGQRKQLITVPAFHLEMEHSLLSISKWESVWKVPFVEHRSLATEQFLDYCRCMTINRQKNPEIYRFLRQTDADKINAYITDTMSARTIRQRKEQKRKPPDMPMTSEYFYWLMIQLGIPFECEKWHFGRLLALIDICQSKSGNEKPMTYKERQRFYQTLNEQRRKAMGTKG